jgi:hypothetical protein
MNKKMYLHPITKSEFISGKEYFEILNSKLYDKYLKEMSETLTKL